MPRRQTDASIAPPPTEPATSVRPEGLRTATTGEAVIEAALDAGVAPHGVVQRAAETASEVLSDAVEAAGRLVHRRGEGRRGLPRRVRKTLPNLFEMHPEARIASRRQLGLRTIPVKEVVGTAVEGGAQRGVNFQPLPQLRSRNWRGRYQRIRAAQEHLAVLPPIDVLQTDEGYWVVDGHNRVAAALEGGQDEIDAVVTHVHLPGSKEPDVAGGSLAAMLADGEELRAAGAGLLTPGSSLASRLGDPRAQRRFRKASGATAAAPVDAAAPAGESDGNHDERSDRNGAPDERDQPDS